MTHEMKSVAQFLKQLNSEGYKESFSVTNENTLVCRDTSEAFKPDEIIIEKTYRFEGDSNPDDTSIVYAMTGKSGTRGTLVDAYGIYSDPVIDEFIKSVPVREENELQDNRP
jgi:hypothetical protein